MITLSWRYQTEEELDGSSHWGLLDITYSGAGYVQVISDSKISRMKGNFRSYLTSLLAIHIGNT